MKPEERLQCDIVLYLRGDPERGIPGHMQKPWMLWATQNESGGRERAREGAKRKRMGRLPGVIDLFVLGPGPRLIAVECKAPPKPLKTGGLSKAKPRISEDQRAVINALGVNGVPTLIVRDLDDCLAALARMGVPLRGTAHVGR